MIEFVRSHSVSGNDLETLFSARAVSSPAAVLKEAKDWPASLDRLAADRFVDAVWRRMRPQVNRCVALFLIWFYLFRKTEIVFWLSWHYRCCWSSCDWSNSSQRCMHSRLRSTSWRQFHSNCSHKSCRWVSLLAFSRPLLINRLHSPITNDEKTEDFYFLNNYFLFIE